MATPSRECPDPDPAINPTTMKDMTLTDPPNLSAHDLENFEAAYRPSAGGAKPEAVPRGRLNSHPGEGHLSIVVNRFAACLQHFRETSP